MATPNFSDLAKICWKKRQEPLIYYINNKHNQLLKEKARLIGFIMGDGSITSLGKPLSLQNHVVSFYPDDKRMLDLFLSDFEKLYLKKPTVKFLGKYYSVRVNSKPACEDLRSYGKFSSLNWEFPERLKSQEEKIEWLKAIFDCEAYVCNQNITIQSVSKKGINSIKRLLDGLKITSKIYTYQRKNRNWNLNYILSISKRSILDYKKIIGFNNSKKQSKLDSLPVCQNG
jgi:hypothetical protein